MAIFSFYIAECDLCRDRSEAFHAGIYTKVDVWQVLHEIGWTRRQLSTDMGMTYKCPSCSSNAFPGKPAADKVVA